MSERNVRGLHIALKDGFIWITIPDSITMDTYQQVEYGIESVLTDGGDKIVIDLGKTKNMYSAGFGLIVRLRKRIAQNKGAMYLVNVSPRVMEGLSSVGLHKVVSIYEEGARLDFLGHTKR
jgi:anti-anti-sigma factor